MNAREYAYYITSRILGKFVDTIVASRFFALFNFQASDRLLTVQQFRQWFRTIGIFLALSSIVLLFVANAIWSFVDHQFFPDNLATTRNFLEDIPNLLNYLVICPVYITFGVCYISYTVRLRHQLGVNRVFSTLGINLPERSTRILTFWAVLAIAATVFSITAYASELYKYQTTFWFHLQTSNGERILSAHGFYYVVTNIFLNLVTVLVIISTIQLFHLSSIISKAIRARTRSAEPLDPLWLSPEKLIDTFSPFCDVYTLSKVLVLAYLANMYTWKAQQPGFFGMLDITILILALGGAALVSYPRYHLQSAIFDLWRKQNKQSYPEIRVPLQIGVAHVADILILGTAMTNLILYVLEKSNIHLSL